MTHGRQHTRCRYGQTPHVIRNRANGVARRGQGKRGGQRWPLDNVCSSIALQMSVAKQMFRVANYKF